MFRHVHQEDEMKLFSVRAAMAWCLFVAVICLLAVPLHAQSDAANVYKAKCSVCHAPDGSGNVAMGKQLGAKDLRSAETQKQTEAQLADSIANGVGKKMPAYKGKLTDDQIKALAGYILSLGKK
jgi:mono/diheme cytochrome c family protein